jgi:hypothetical protein
VDAPKEKLSFKAQSASHGFDENFLDPLWSARSHNQSLGLMRAVFKTYSTALSSDERQTRCKKNTQATLPENRRRRECLAFRARGWRPSSLLKIFKRMPHLKHMRSTGTHTL